MSVCVRDVILFSLLVTMGGVGGVFVLVVTATVLLLMFNIVHYKLHLYIERYLLWVGSG